MKRTKTYKQADCLKCGNKFRYRYFKSTGIRRFCSKHCSSSFNCLNNPALRASHVIARCSPQRILNMPRGEKHFRWKNEEDVGYRALHIWVQNHLGTPGRCENCLRNGLVGRAIHWANLSGKYKRDLTDWVRLCVKCHKNYDTKTYV